MRFIYKIRRIIFGAHGRMKETQDSAPQQQSLIIILPTSVFGCVNTDDFAYLPHMQLLNLGGIIIALGLTFKNGGGLGGIWWCLVLYFGTRLVYHSFYIGTHWNSHVSC
jgi:hypothetical protein